MRVVIEIDLREFVGREFELNVSGYMGEQENLVATFAGYSNDDVTFMYTHTDSKGKTSGRYIYLPKDRVIKLIGGPKVLGKIDLSKYKTK